MIAEAIDRILSLHKPRTVEFNGELYTTETLRMVTPKMLHPAPLSLSTLDSLIYYLETNPDNWPMTELFLSILSPDRVMLYGTVGGDLSRHEIAKIEIENNEPFDMHKFHPADEMVVMLLTRFAPGGDRELLLELIGNMVSEQSVNVADDGITPVVTVRQGISLKDSRKIPIPCMLRPWKTFRELEQPEIPYIVRLEKMGGGIAIRLVDASGNAWVPESIRKVRDYLREKLSERSLEIPVLG